MKRCDPVDYLVTEKYETHNIKIYSQLRNAVYKYVLKRIIEKSQHRKGTLEKFVKILPSVSTCYIFQKGIFSVFSNRGLKFCVMESTKLPFERNENIKEF